MFILISEVTTPLSVVEFPLSNDFLSVDKGKEGVLKLSLEMSVTITMTLLATK